MESHGNGVVDFGRFLTGFFVVMGIGTCGSLGGHGMRRNSQTRDVGKRIAQDQRNYIILTI